MGPRSVIRLSIKRCPDPASGEICEENAAWAPRLRQILRARTRRWNCPDLLDSAELVLTELVTNAFRHASAPTVDVCIRRRGDRLRIAVDDHSTRGPLPRPKGLYEEHGRGLVLVDVLADAWGISEDRTTTWCVLRLPEGLPGMSTGPAPVRHESMLQVPGGPDGLGLADLRGRDALALLDWPGDRHAALEVLRVLAGNAVQHGITEQGPGPELTIWLRVTAACELIIDVRDPSPKFPRFQQAVVGELGRGLWGARRLGAVVTWSPELEAGGKTVRAVMQPGEVIL
ncbi:ATP-binding protein [Streptomyces sp. NPDC058861]|uniref:ATP-binding protein n=1 Tax=Streptomyces sp. NPDC058861 TaxID=3346653 RepID=UPI0036A4CD4F